MTRRFPMGAEVHGDGVHFRVWAPGCKRVILVLDGTSDEHVLEREVSGYHALFVRVGAGARYRFLLDGRGPFPDPASRFQPEGPHGPSEVVDPGSFGWTDGAWQGVSAEDRVLYEMHIGTFTNEGTWSAAIAKLPDLAELGITVLEIMPVAEFPGRFGWGYDGVDLFAPTRLYGRPDDFRRFVDRAHALGMGVILDVVYNHVGPDGNYLHEFSPAYFTDRYENEWGKAINFDGDDAQPVRDFFITNAACWIAEYHLDGLRLDATQQIFDASPTHVLKAVAEAARQAAGGRATYITAENERQEMKLVDDYGIDALWNDDFHHSAVVALTGHREAYYSDHFGTAQELLSALKYGFLFQGQYYAWQKAPRGAPALHAPAHRYIHFIENHDQVANSATGARLHQLAAAGHMRAMTALLLLGPQTPMLFQGQEFASSRPFLFFADHNPELARAVARGRAEFLAQFHSIAAGAHKLVAPHDPEAFASCRLDHRERDKNRTVWVMHRDLIQLRKTDPVIGRAQTRVDGALIGRDAFLVRYFTDDDTDRLLVVNLGNVLDKGSIADPLAAPCAGTRWRTLWSSEDPRYGGAGSSDIEHGDGWRVPGKSVTLLAAQKL